MSQFAFLQPEFSPVYDHARKAESVALSDPRTACFYARLALETAVKWMYERDKALRTATHDCAELGQASAARAISGVEQGQGTRQKSARRISRLGEAVHQGERRRLGQGASGMEAGRPKPPPFIWAGSVHDSPTALGAGTPRKQRHLTEWQLRFTGTGDNPAGAPLHRENSDRRNRRTAQKPAQLKSR